MSAIVIGKNRKPQYAVGNKTVPIQPEPSRSYGRYIVGGPAEILPNQTDEMHPIMTVHFNKKIVEEKVKAYVDLISYFNKLELANSGLPIAGNAYEWIARQMAGDIFSALHLDKLQWKFENLLKKSNLQTAREKGYKREFDPDFPNNSELISTPIEELKRKHVVRKELTEKEMESVIKARDGEVGKKAKANDKKKVKLKEETVVTNIDPNDSAKREVDDKFSQLFTSRPVLPDDWINVEDDGVAISDVFYPHRVDENQTLEKFEQIIKRLQQDVKTAKVPSKKTSIKKNSVVLTERKPVMATSKKKTASKKVPARGTATRTKTTAKKPAAKKK